MNRILMLVMSVSLCHLCVWSQTAREEIAGNVLLSGHYITAYPGPLQDTLTQAPSGKKPFYISLYGRHGSRWMNNATFYEKPMGILQAADGQGVLNAFGKKVLSDLQVIADDAAGRYEELTPVGQRQWQDIGKRMTLNFPEVFRDGARVDARSTIYTRCILSMSGTLMELKAFNPRLRIEERASEQDMPFLLSGFYSKSSNVRDDDSQRFVSNAISVPKIHSLRVASELISNRSYIEENVDTTGLFSSLLDVVSSVQNSELGDSLMLYDIFTDEELYEGWRVMNVKSYNSYHKGTKAKTLLLRIIEDADEAIAKGDVAAHLRFGHEVVLLPTICLMGLNNFDSDWSSADEIEAAGWRNYHLYPMAGNIQVVFFRSGDNDPDILVKVLLNEKEAVLPISTDIAPYYHWNDVKAYWQAKAQ